MGGVDMNYNGGTQPHPMLMFNLAVTAQGSLATSEPENAYIRIESEGTIEFEDTYFDAPTVGGMKTFCISG